MKTLFLLITLLLIITGCTTPLVVEQQDSAPLIRKDVSNIPNATPKYELYSKYGNPSTYEALGKTYRVKKSAVNHVERGIASWYGTKFHGRRTSSGEAYDMYQMTAAHKSLPLPTYAEVTNLDNGRKIVVKINDRGPFVDGRIIDLSYTAAIKLGIDKKGTGRVELRTITFPEHGGRAVAKAVPLAAPFKITKIESIPTSLQEERPSRSLIYLQMGSFSERENMQRMFNRLIDASVSNVTILQPNTASPYFRLRIGPLLSRNHADNMAVQLQTMGFGKPYVVVD